MVNMLSAFIFLNCDIEEEPAIIHERDRIARFSGTMRMPGAYYIVAKISQESKENIARLVKKIGGKIASVRLSLTMIVAKDSKSPDKVVV
jgi:hypothetical protein